MPEDFDYQEYRKSNPNIANQSDEWLRWHYCTRNVTEKHICKVNLPPDFNVDDYRQLNTDISQQSDTWLEWHYEVYGKFEGRQYCHPPKSIHYSELTSSFERVSKWCESSLHKQELTNHTKELCKNAIVIFSSIERSFLSNQKIQYLQQIANCWNVELVIYRSPSEFLTQQQLEQAYNVKSFRPNVHHYICKLLCIHKALYTYERVMWLDDTSVISQFTPNPFNIVPAASIGALVVPRDCGLTESISDYNFILKNKNIAIRDEYYNTGTMIVPSVYRDIFSFDNIIAYQDLFQSPYPTQAWLNYITNINNCSIFDMTCMFNMMPCCLEYSSVNWQNTSLTHLYPDLLKYYIVHFTGFHRNRESFHNDFFQLQQNTLNEKITIVVMNFHRPSNIKDFILPYYTSIPAVERIIVVHCRFETLFEYVSDKVLHVHEWDTDKTYGVFTRYIAAKKYATTKCLLFTDDDVVIPAKTILSIYQKWKENTNKVVGAEGRKLHKNTTNDEYEYKPTTFYGDVDFVLTSCCMTSIENIECVCNNEYKMHDYTSKTKTKWNGEDIFLGLLTESIYKTSCYAIQMPVNYLSNNEHAISSSKQHVAERTTFINLFYKMCTFTSLPTAIEITSNLCLNTTNDKNINVRCEQGFGNQLRIFLAGVYLLNNGFINSFTQEWVLNDHNNVNFLDFFIPPIGVVVTNNSEQSYKSSIIRESTFRGLIQKYAPHIHWKDAILESFNYLHVKPHINEYVKTFVESNNIYNSIGVHARRTCKTAFLTNGDNTNRILPISNNKIIELCNNSSLVFVATDNHETQTYLKTNIASHVVTVADIVSGLEKYPHNTYSTDRVYRYTTDTHAALDFLILKYCKMFIGSNESSFSLLLYYWRNNNLDYYIHGKL